MTDQPEHAAELEAIAFLYVAGELDEPQRSEFEARLADDPIAQDAVVEIMHLTDGVLQAIESSDVIQKVGAASLNQTFSAPGHRRSLMPLSLFAASVALLLVALSWSFVFPPENSDIYSVAEDDSIAVAWADYVQPAADETAIEEESWDESDELINVDTASWMAIALADIGADEIGGEE